MPDITVTKKIQEIDENLSEGFNFDPKYVQNYYVDNIVSRVIAYLTGWDVTHNKPIRLTSTSDGLLKVASYPIIFEHNDTKTGYAPDAWSAPIVFDQVVNRMDVWIFDNPAKIQRSIDGVAFQDAIEIPANTMYSFDAATHSFKIKNVILAMNARYQIIGWY